MDTSVPLVHAWDSQPIAAISGLFPIGDGVSIPALWQPKVTDIEPRAIPTPFARAEAVRLLLTRAEDAWDNDLLHDFRWLLMGIAAGVLRLEPSDLADERFDNLGRALLQVDPGARYFCRVLWHDRSLPFGATYRSCLLWGHSRRSREDWNRLTEAIQPRQAQALLVLAEWREALRRVGSWAPSRVPWQRGVDQVVGATEPSRDLQNLRENTMLVGPVWLDLPSQRADEPVRAEPVYLPAWSPGFAGRFMSLCKFRPVPAKEAAEFVDARGVVVGRVRMPPSGKDRDLLAMGMGLVELAGDETPRIAAAPLRLWVQGPGGLVEVLQPLQHALESAGRPITPASMSTMAPLYPDAIRIPFQRGLWPGASNQSTFTGRAALLLTSGGHVLPEPPEAESAGGAQAVLEAGTLSVRLVLLDRLGEIDVLDLRALGLVLFRVFDHEAGVLAELGGNLGDVSTLEALMLHSVDSPLEPTAKVYDAVALPPPDTLRRRLATLQRFVRSYEGEAPGLDRLLERAARAFARWASGLAEVSPKGRRGARSVTYRLAMGCEARLATDAVGA